MIFQTKSYRCECNGRPSSLTLDLVSGFVLYDSISQVFLLPSSSRECNTFVTSLLKWLVSVGRLVAPVQSLARIVWRRKHVLPPRFRRQQCRCPYSKGKCNFTANLQLQQLLWRHRLFQDIDFSSNFRCVLMATQAFVFARLALLEPSILSSPWRHTS